MVGALIFFISLLFLTSNLAIKLQQLLSKWAEDFFKFAQTRVRTLNLFYFRLCSYTFPLDNSGSTTIEQNITVTLFSELADSLAMDMSDSDHSTTDPQMESRCQCYKTFLLHQLLNFFRAFVQTFPNIFGLG